MTVLASEYGTDSWPTALIKYLVLALAVLLLKMILLEYFRNREFKFYFLRIILLEESVFYSTDLLMRCLWS